MDVCFNTFLIICSNMLAPKLTDADIATMKADVAIGKRLIRAYRLILDFYGMNLVDEMTGAVIVCDCSCG